MRGLQSCRPPNPETQEHLLLRAQPHLHRFGLEADQVPELDRGQTGVAQVADFPHTAADVAGQVIGGPKAFVRSLSAGLFRFRQ